MKTEVMKQVLGGLMVIGLGLGVRAGAEPRVEGWVRLVSGEPAAGAQVRLFDLSDLRKMVAATTDETGYFALSLGPLQGASALPEQFSLGQNYPNPFNPSTIIPYRLPVSTHVRLDVFNLLGQRIATLVDEEQPAGFHTSRWDATDATGRAVASGVYLYRLQGGGVSLTHRMVLVDGPAGVPAAGSAAGDPAAEGDRSAEPGIPVYGLTVSGRGLVTHVNPAFRVEADGGPVDLMVEALVSAPRPKVAAGGLLGDVDNNGQVDIADALMVATYLADNSIAIPNNGDISLGDVNQDRRIDYLDVWFIVTYYVMPSSPGLPEGIGSPVPPRIETLKMYWTDLGTGKIQRADLDGSYVEDLVTTGLRRPFGLTLDVAAGKMYWTDFGTNKIQRADLDGSNVEDLITTGISGPLGLSLDVAAGKLYWVDAGEDKIQRSDLDGSNVEDLISTGLGLPNRLALDVAAGKMYWTDQGTNKIQRADLDGSNVEDLKTLLLAPLGLALDVAAGKLYWVDAGEDKIQRSDLDGSNVEDLISTGSGLPYRLALDVAAGKMYWTDQGTNKIQRADLDGSNIEDLITTGLMRPSGLVLDTPRASLSPDPSTVAFGNDGTWHSFTVQASEPIVVVVNPVGSTPLVESNDIADASNECRAEAEESTARGNGEAIYLAGCGPGKGIVELRRASNQAVLQSYTLSIEKIPTPGIGAEKMYWTNRGEDKIQRSDLDGSNVEDIVTTGSPRGLALDMVEGKIYWTDQGTRKIRRAELDGTEVEDLVTGLGNPVGLAVNVGEGKVYWTDTSTEKIQRANLDGSQVEDLVTEGLSHPTGLALDGVRGKIYWTDWGTDKIQRAYLDGYFVEDLVTSGLSSPEGLALDVGEGKIYWTDYGTDKIQRADLDGSNVEDLVVSGLSIPRGLALDLLGGKMYWTDSGGDRIKRANLDGTEVEDLVTTGLANPLGLALDSPAAALSPTPYLVGLRDDGTWRPFTVHASEPVVVVANLGDRTAGGVEVTDSSGEFNDCPADSADSIARQDGQTVYLAGCARGEGRVELRRASDHAVLQTYICRIMTYKMYWATKGTVDKIQRGNLDSTEVEDLVTTGLNLPRSLALDVVRDKMYWTNTNTSKIQRANLDGSQVEDLVTTADGLDRPSGLALDVGEGKIYWTDYGTFTRKIQRANLDGSQVEDLVTTGLGNPLGLALDVGRGKMYWTDFSNDKIQRADLDGSDVEDLVTGLDTPIGLALDVGGSKMYWTDESSDKIQRANLDGSDIEDLVTTGLNRPWSLALDVVRGKLYWTDYGTKKIQRANLDGFQVEDLVTGPDSPLGIALDIPETGGQ